MAIQKKQRFWIATIVASFALVLGLIKLFGTSHFTAGAGGRWIRVYPHPFEVMVITVMVMLLLLWLYQWYQRDPVQHFLKTLGDNERQQMFELLARDGRHKLKRDDQINHLRGYDEDTYENEAADELTPIARRKQIH